MRMCDLERDVQAIVEIDNLCWEQAGLEFRLQESELRNDWTHFENFEPQSGILPRDMPCVKNWPWRNTCGRFPSLHQ